MSAPPPGPPGPPGSSGQQAGQGNYDDIIWKRFSSLT